MEINYDSNGLIPAICQDVESGEVLMMAWMNSAALRLTFEKGDAYFWSRSRQELWHKGATSGNKLKLVSIWVDCEDNSLLVKAHPVGPTCHTGRKSCFHNYHKATSPE